MHTLDVREAARLLHLSPKRVQSLARAGKLPALRVGRKWLFRREHIERLLGGPVPGGGTVPGGRPAPGGGGPAIALSARNRLRGTITGLRVDGLMAEVQLRIGDQELISVITRTSAERLGLARGDEVFAVIKSTEVMIGKPGERE